MLRELVAEALGTALLLAVVVGSGIMGESLAAGNMAVALLANSLAAGAALVVLILVFAPISGAHLNPVVTLSAAGRGKLSWSRVAPYLVAQVVGAFAGVLVAHVMFGQPAFTASSHVRTGSGQLVSEVVATFGLILTLHAVERNRPAAVPYAVALYILAAYWFTASTSFANPAGTLARAATATFAGIRPIDVPGFLLAQLLGGGAAVALVEWLWSPLRRRQTVRPPVTSASPPRRPARAHE